MIPFRSLSLFILLTILTAFMVGCEDNPVSPDESGGYTLQKVMPENTVTITSSGCIMYSTPEFFKDYTVEGSTLSSDVALKFLKEHADIYFVRYVTAGEDKVFLHAVRPAVYEDISFILWEDGIYDTLTFDAYSSTTNAYSKGTRDYAFRLSKDQVEFLKNKSVSYVLTDKGDKTLTYQSKYTHECYKKLMQIP